MTVQPVDYSGEEAVDFVDPLPPTKEELDAADLIWMERLAQPWHPTERQPFRPVRCTGVTKNGVRQGRQCPHPAILGASVCAKHGAQLPVVRQAAIRRTEEARLRLIDSSHDAVDTLVDLMKNSGSDPVRLGAAKEVLDRAGVRGGIDVAVEVTERQDPAAVLRAKISQVRERVIPGNVIASDTDSVEVAEPGDTVAESTPTPHEEQSP